MGVLKNNWESALVWVFCFFAGLSQMVARYGRIAEGPATFVNNVTKVWRPVAEMVMNGTPLYLGTAVDNKPPLFWFVNLAAYESGYYEPVMFVLVGIANGSAGVLLYHWLTSRRNRRVATVATLLFIATLPAVHGTYINVRSFAVVFILLALLSKSALTQGALLAAGALFTQYTVFLVPLFVYRYHRSGKLLRGVSRATIGGAVVFCVAYGAVATIWNLNAALSGLYYTFNLPIGQLPGVSPPIEAVRAPSGYFSQETAPSILGRTIVWGGFVFYRVGLLLHVLPAAAVWVYVRFSSAGKEPVAPVCFEILFGGLLLMMPLFLRGHALYWILPLPFLAAAASGGYCHIIQNTD